MLQSLEQKGYIVRVASTEDARLKRILLTEKAIEHHNLIEGADPGFQPRAGERYDRRRKADISEFFR